MRYDRHRKRCGHFGGGQFQRYREKQLAEGTTVLQNGKQINFTVDVDAYDDVGDDDDDDAADNDERTIFDVIIV
ncbi:unnamed protein product [Enterobius vermicularis]|uniref:Uncharacterized protein n=1 Tax=Enterobius vermicularis TaxID=51028 RepID=A0A0N4V9E2_ENTVE|nr:unnamed protein product [Enterobius vermicularis]